MVGSKKQNILLLTVICCASLALISITWAAFSSTLKLSGQASVAAQSWDIDFTNTIGTKWTTAQSLTGTKTNLAELPTTSSGAFSLPVDQTASGFLGSLRMSGDKITYTWYVQNFGTFEAKYSISGLIKTDSYANGSNVDITCNTSDNLNDKTFCNNYVKTTLTIDGVVASPTDSYTLAKAGETGDSSTLVLTIEIIGDNQIYTATAKAMDNYFNSNPTMLRSDLEMLDNSNDLSISVKGLTLSGTQSVADTMPVTTAIATTIPAKCIELVNNSWTYDYSNSEITLDIECTGTYKLEVWGAQGGDSNTQGGYGGYSVGEVKLSSNDKLYINVASSGSKQTNTQNSYNSVITLSGGYNGGGTAYGNQTSGGGATSIALSSGLLSSFSSNLADLLIVAGGGGGGSYTCGGNGGGYVANAGCSDNSSGGGGGTQTSGGAGAISNHSTFKSGTLGSYSTFGSDGTFGLGGQSGLNGGAGGAGFYGGGGGCTESNDTGGGGGSSYIANSRLSNKSMYCYNCSESNDENTKTISNTCINSTATSECSKTGNGYAKITYVSYS